MKFSNLEVKYVKMLSVSKETEQRTIPIPIYCSVFSELGTVVVVIVWYVDLQLPVQSVPISPLIL